MTDMILNVLRATRTVGEPPIPAAMELSRRPRRVWRTTWLNEYTRSHSMRGNPDMRDAGGGAGFRRKWRPWSSSWRSQGHGQPAASRYVDVKVGDGAQPEQPLRNTNDW